MAAGNTYEAIFTTTLGSAAASVTFSSIPSTYTDLVIIVAGTDSALAAIGLQFNSDTGTNYSRITLSGDGSAASSDTQSSHTSSNIGLVGTVQSNTIFSVMNYANTTTYKTTLAKANEPNNLVRAAVGLWRNTSAITSIKLLANSFQTGTTFSLYGIASA
jgi:hypothetical protein